MAGVKVYELARELGRNPLSVVELARAAGINITSASATLHPRQVEVVRMALERAEARRQTSPPRPTRTAPVSLSGPPRPRGALATARCTCCALPFRHDPARLLPGVPAPERCEACREHYEISGEDDARKLARYEDHDRRIRAAWEHASKRATEYEERMKAAYRTRDGWKAALVTVVLAHEESGGKCRCGASRHPCYTVLKLEDANRGIARQVEQLGTLSERELERELYPDDDGRRGRTEGR